MSVWPVWPNKSRLVHLSEKHYFDLQLGNLVLPTVQNDPAYRSILAAAFFTGLKHEKVNQRSSENKSKRQILLIHSQIMSYLVVALLLTLVASEQNKGDFYHFYEKNLILIVPPWHYLLPIR